MATLNKRQQTKNPLKCEICAKEFKSNKSTKNHFNIIHKLMKENQCNILINTTKHNNEIVKQRLSCIPIHITDDDFPLDTYELIVKLLDANNQSLDDYKDLLDILGILGVNDFASRIVKS